MYNNEHSVEQKKEYMTGLSSGLILSNTGSGSAGHILIGNQAF